MLAGRYSGLLAVRWLNRLRSPLPTLGNASWSYPSGSTFPPEKASSWSTETVPHQRFACPAFHAAAPHTTYHVSVTTTRGKLLQKISPMVMLRAVAPRAHHPKIGFFISSASKPWNDVIYLKAKLLKIAFTMSAAPIL